MRSLFQPLNAERQQSFPQTIVLIIALALGYFVAGKFVEVFLAMPGVYSISLWPSAGLALAALLRFGNHVWPGILLGALLINLSMLIDTSSSQTFIKSFFIAGSIGIGASIQALVGLLLIKRTVEIESGLIHARDIVFFLGLGGPISCLISATWGVSSLWLGGIIGGEQFFLFWLTWWIGDSIGVLLVVPLLLIWFGKPRSAWRQRNIRVAVPLLITLALDFFMFSWSSQQELENINSEFSKQSVLLSDTLESKLQQNVEVVYSIHSLFKTSESVTREQFRNFVQGALQRNSSIHALSWNPVVSARERSQFEQQIRSEGRANFTITERNLAGNLIPAEQRQNYVVVDYIEPLQGNEKAIGYDVYSNPIRRQAMDYASLSGDIVATNPIRLVQETSNQTGILVFVPVYTGGATPDSELDKARLLKGFVVGVFRTGDLLDQSLPGIKMTDIVVELFDITDPEQPVPIAGYELDQQANGRILPLEQIPYAEQALSWQRDFRFAQRNWSIKVGASDLYLNKHRSWVAWGVMTAGLLFATLLGAFLLILTGRVILDQARANELSKQIKQRELVEQTLHTVNQQLEKLARTDSLTQVHNRRSIQEIGREYDAESKRYKTSYSVIMLDIDYFKDVNDRYGHHVGDKVLQEVASLISEQMRETDFIGRWGGEEFVILSKLTNLKDCKNYAQRLRKAVADQDIDPIGNITISLGVSAHKQDEKFEDVVRRADKALYTAKDKGRNRVESLSKD